MVQVRYFLVQSYFQGNRTFYTFSVHSRNNSWQVSLLRIFSPDFPASPTPQGALLLAMSQGCAHNCFSHCLLSFSDTHPACKNNTLVSAFAASPRKNPQSTQLNSAQVCSVAQWLGQQPPIGSIYQHITRHLIAPFSIQPERRVYSIPIRFNKG